MANPEHLAILKQGVEEWNGWRAQHPQTRPSLSKADLSGRFLSGAQLSRADLSRADLSRADLISSDLSQANLIATKLTAANLANASLPRAYLSSANLGGANLSGANLCGANLRGADLRRVNLTAADLSQADLRDARLSGADLRKANFRRANLAAAHLDSATLFDTVFADTDLSQVQGLEAVAHLGPSLTSVETLLRSKGQLPGEFLRGVGVPDVFIEFLPSLVKEERAIQCCSACLRYSYKDEEFAKRLHARLRAAHLRVWTAPVSDAAGAATREATERTLQEYDCLMLVLSEHSLGSEWLAVDLRQALETGTRDKRHALLPICLAHLDKLQAWKCFDAEAGKDLAEEIRREPVPDFSNWKNADAFEKAAGDLLAELQTRLGLKA
jgi:hypothetical protein